MKNPVNEPEVLTEIKIQGTSMVKNKMFDIIAFGIVGIMFFVGLGALKIIDFTLESYLNFIISFIPFYLSSMLLNSNYYTKGTYKGKESEKYLLAMQNYSDTVDELDGDMQCKLDDFVAWYNDNALKRVQTAILKSVAITYERFVNWVKIDDVKKKPLLQYTHEELVAEYGEQTAHVIRKAQHASIKGISVNALMGNFTSVDPTDIGKNAAQLRRERLGITGVMSFISVSAMTLIGFKDILEWGWVAAFVTLFKMIYIFARSYQMYFHAYDDITVSVVNHIARKTDILKQFKSWYNENYSVSE